MPNENLLPVEEAKIRILSKIGHTVPTTIKTSDALHQVLAKDIISPIDLPPFSNSSMDGYAVRSEDLTKITESNHACLTVIEDIPAGYQPQKIIIADQASRIMTGAALPFGADAVVPVEFTNLADQYDLEELPKTITIYKKVNLGDYVRPQGQDIQKNSKILPKFHFLRPQDLGLISGIGIEFVDVFPKPKVALISSGDEIISPGKKLRPGQIYDINTYSISSLLETFGANIIHLGVADDTPSSVERILRKAVEEKVDLIVSTAGVSLGVYDHIRSVILKNGNLDFWRVNIRPGKPLVFGNYRSIPFFGVPGNPVSAFIISLVFLNPVIAKLSARPFIEAQQRKATLQEDIESDGRESYLRGLIIEKNGKFEAKLTGHQGSGNILSLVSANALLVIPAGVKSVPKGQEVSFIALEPNL